MYARHDNIVRPRSFLMRLLVRPGVYRHPKVWAAICSAAGAWLVILGGILCSAGFWWGALLIAVAALELRIAWNLHHSVRT